MRQSEGMAEAGGCLGALLGGFIEMLFDCLSPRTDIPWYTRILVIVCLGSVVFGVLFLFVMLCSLRSGVDIRDNWLMLALLILVICYAAYRVIVSDARDE